MNTAIKNRKKGTKSHRLVGLKELRTNMEKYIEAVDQGVSFTVLRRSKPVFRIYPAVDEFGEPQSGWENFDFRDEKGKGVPAAKFLKMMRKHGSAE